MYRVATVCTGNICRSPMAEFMLIQALDKAGLSSSVRVESFGISDWEDGNPMDPRASAWLLHEEIGVQEKISAHASRPITLRKLSALNLVLALDVEHLRFLEKLAEELPDDEENTPHLRLLGSFNPRLAEASGEKQGIYDPWYGGEKDFHAVADLITPCLPAVVDFIREDARARAILNVE